MVFVALTTIPAGTADADYAQTLTGRYHWDQRGGSSGDVEAVFTPVGEMQWEVSFRFKFRGNSHTYRGRAEGELNAQGKLSGKVRNEGGNRSFTFRGSFNKNGKFSGTHSETTGGRTVRTGTLTLSIS